MAIKISGVTIVDDDRKQTNLRLTTSVITSNTTAVAGTYYYLNDTGITLTLPSSPATGDQVGIAEIAGDTTSVISRNSANIMSISENLVIDKAYAAFRLIYVDSTEGWVFT